MCNDITYVVRDVNNIDNIERNFREFLNRSDTQNYTLTSNINQKATGLQYPDFEDENKKANFYSQICDNIKEKKIGNISISGDILIKLFPKIIKSINNSQLSLKTLAYYIQEPFYETIYTQLLRQYETNIKTLSGTYQPTNNPTLVSRHNSRKY